MDKKAASLGQPEEVVAFWLEAGMSKWFVKDAAFDREIRARGGALQERSGWLHRAIWASTGW